MITQFLRYNIIGIVNTLFGFSIIAILMILEFDEIQSNFLGYLFGSILSYFLNTKYTFKSNRTLHQAFKFLTILIICYILNLLTLKLLLSVKINPYIAQAVSMIVYSISSFIIIKLTLFKDSIE